MSSDDIHSIGQGSAGQKSGTLCGLVASDGERELVGQIGCDLINRLFVLTRNALLFDLNNEALERPVALFLEKLGELENLQEAKASIGIVHDNLFLNDALLRPDAGTYQNSRFLQKVFKLVKAKEFQFETDCREDQLRAFLGSLRKIVEGLGDTSSLAKIEGFKIIPLSEVEAAADDEELDRRIQVLRTFASCITLMARIITLASRGQRWSPSLVRRIAYELSDATSHEPNLMLALIHLPVELNRLAAHLVRVGILSYICAANLEMPRKSQAEAVMIALCHHLKAPSEEDVYQTAEELNSVDDQPIRSGDPIEAVQTLCTGKGLNEGLIRRSVGVYEATGAANNDSRLYLSFTANDLLGQIVTITDRYSMLLANLKPDEALRMVLLELDKEEPEIAQALIRGVGLFPVGTLVQLESGVRAVVMESPQHRRHLLHPVVQIIDGAEHAVVDLSTGDHAYGRVVRTLSSAQINLNVSHLFLL